MYSDNLVHNDNYTLFNMRDNYQLVFDLVFICFIFTFPVFYFKKKYNFIPSMIGNSDDEDGWCEDSYSDNGWRDYEQDEDDSDEDLEDIDNDYDDNIYEFCDDLTFGVLGLCYLGLEGTYNFCSNKLHILLEEIAKDNYDRDMYYRYYATSWPWIQGTYIDDNEEIVDSNNLGDNDETDAEIDQMLDDIPDPTTSTKSQTTNTTDQNITGTLSSVMEEILRDKPIEEDLAMLKNCMNIFNNLCHDLNEQSKINPDVKNGIELLPLPSSIKSMIDKPELANKLCDNVIQWAIENPDEERDENPDEDLDTETNDFELIIN